MSSLPEAQQEELEVLRSIYEGDSNFKEVEENKFTYKVQFGDDENDIGKAFLLEVLWPEGYPEAVPKISLDAFFNNHLSQDTKDSLLTLLAEQCEENVGEAVTFTLIEWAKENTEDILAANVLVVATESEAPVDKGDSSSAAVAKKKEKKEQLTKGQKRRLVVRFGANADERPRGWDWVDIIRHLSRTGSSQPS